MHCPMCTRVMLSRSSQTIEEEKGALVITSWRCNPCDQIYEDIWASKNYEGMRPQRLFYRVRSTERPAPAVFRLPSRVRRIQAHAVVG
jgi:C4-type Zn-finger protein